MNIDIRAIQGEYTRRRGACRTYDYEASWARAGDGITWWAVVRWSGMVRGRPGGGIGVVPSDMDATQFVRDTVERSIEFLVGVTE